MLLNMDFNKTLSIETNTMEWEASPSASVFRKRLAREDRESGHATSLVRYSPNASFHRHAHPEGEEILVLGGIFSDENGDYPAGSYIRNPPSSAHAPFSRHGCVLFVKLDQFQAGDNKVVRLDIGQSGEAQAEFRQEVLHQYRNETTYLINLNNGSDFQLSNTTAGVEVLVISGSVTINNRLLSQHGWFRSTEANSTITACTVNTRLLLKAGHLINI